uniref:Lipocalin/cytosolic fatty-acid binding domain-containing protein n=1 Tax=Salarias fasciatus TaxID=181472 RepID=A0A672G5Q3_SALFA
MEQMGEYSGPLTTTLKLTIEQTGEKYSRQESSNLPHIEIDFTPESRFDYRVFHQKDNGKTLTTTRIIEGANSYSYEGVDAKRIFKK